MGSGISGKQTLMDFGFRNGRISNKMLISRQARISSCLKYMGIIIKAHGVFIPDNTT